MRGRRRRRTPNVGGEEKIAFYVVSRLYLLESGMDSWTKVICLHPPTEGFYVTAGHVTVDAELPKIVLMQASVAN